MEMLLLMLLMVCGFTHGLNNGLARTPPMGFLSWERFRCNTDCKNDPENCISEHLYRSIADAMVSEGYKDLGYEYVNIDDCWLAQGRTPDGILQPDPDRFPSGMLNLSRYIHSKGLKFGIYEDFGKETCAGFPGSEFFLKTDADTFAKWEIDLLKFDGCNSDPKDMSVGYPAMSQFLNLTQRPILFSCEWPGYERAVGIKGKDRIGNGSVMDPFPSKLRPTSYPNYTAIRDSCNIWRNYNDIQDSWDSVMSIINYYAKNLGGFADIAGPGGFNDPDELLIGDYGLSYYQQKAQFGMWAMLSAPLFISADVRKMNPESKAILQNKRVIAINQDPRGAQAKQLYMIQSLQVWLKPLAMNGSYAFALLNADDQGKPTTVTVTPSELNLTSPGGYNITEVYDGTYIGAFKPDDNLKVSIDPTGIFLAIAVPLS